MYLLALDESGTHGSSPCLIVGGVAIHENDVWYLQRQLEEVLLKHLTPLGLSHLDFELHATEIKSPNRQRGAVGGRKRAKSPESKWTQVPQAVRNGVLDDVFTVIADYEPQDRNYPMALFGASVDAKYRDKYRRAYDLVLNKFDEMLGRHFHERGDRQRGVVVHDEHQIERELQGWTKDWIVRRSRVGKLHNIVHVPLFADSKASQLLQAADFIAYAMWRHYGVNDDRWLDQLFPRFDASDGHRHGIIHVRPGFSKRHCGCPPCIERQGRK